MKKKSSRLILFFFLIVVISEELEMYLSQRHKFTVKTKNLNEKKTQEMRCVKFS